MLRDHHPEEETYSDASRESGRNGNDTLQQLQPYLDCLPSINSCLHQAVCRKILQDGNRNCGAAQANNFRKNYMQKSRQRIGQRSRFGQGRISSWSWPKTLVHTENRIRPACNCDAYISRMKTDASARRNGNLNCVETLLVEIILNASLA